MISTISVSRARKAHHSKIENRKQVIGRSKICLLKRRLFFRGFPESPSVIPPASRWHFYNSTVACLRRVSFNIFKLVDTKNLEVKEKKVVLTSRKENSFNLYRPSHPTDYSKRRSPIRNIFTSRQ